jgi:dTDP-4-amino-4,6-dideoxygalactose transaminase
MHNRGRSNAKDMAKRVMRLPLYVGLEKEVLNKIVNSI